MFAAFPGMYATVFSGLYLPLLAILVGMIVAHLRDRMARQDRRPAWRSWADVGIALGRGCPPCLWGVAFAALVRGLPVDADKQIQLSIGDLLNAYTLLGGVGHRRLVRCSTARCSWR